MPNNITLDIRTGLGTVRQDGTFTDLVRIARRCPRQHSGWQSVTFEGMRYELHGGIRTNLFICLNNPIRKPRSIVDSIPPDHPVQPLGPDDNPQGKATCGVCGLSWDDDKATGMTPTPSGRCPFEYFHHTPD